MTATLTPDTDRWTPGRIAIWTAVAVLGALAWGILALARRESVNAVWLVGIANQLLAAVALTVATTILIKSGRVKWAWVTAVPLAWDAAVALSASWYKIFSSDPLIGFFAQRDKYQQALDAGKVIPRPSRWTTSPRSSPTRPSTACSRSCSPP